MSLLFIDTETTGKDEEDRLCQVCFMVGDMERNELYKPPLPIKVSAMAVHHITNEMVADKPPFEGSTDQIMLRALGPSTIFTAHNAPFDLKMLKKEGLEFARSIDTLKIARHLDTEAILESHGLQYLRYYHGLKVEAQAHDALGDVRVLKEVFEVLRSQICQAESLAPEEAVERMVEISSKPTLIRKFTFGKHKDRLVEEVARTDRGYLRWWQEQKAAEPERDEDWLYTLDYYLGK